MTTNDKEPKVEEKAEVEVKKPSKKLPVLTPEQIASRQRAHDIKVAKFLAGGDF